MAEKLPITIHVENRTNALIQECLEDGTQLDQMRDLWYEMKDDNIVVANRDGRTEEEHADALLPTIRKQFALYAETDQSIYTRLGLHSKVFVKGRMPIVVIFEKAKRAALRIIRRFDAGYAFGEGQFPTFESVHVANYFEECGYGIGYVFVITDFDPAGEHLFGQVKKKMGLFTNIIDIKTTWVKFGDNPTSEFESYRLRDNKLNRKWIDDGRATGVEFNTKTNIRKGILTYLAKSINTTVDPRFFVLHSYNQWRDKEIQELEEGDKKFQKWDKKKRKHIKRMRKRRADYVEAVGLLPTEYASLLLRGKIKYNTSTRNSDIDPSEFDNFVWYENLLGERSPYKYDLKEITI